MIARLMNPEEREDIAINLEVLKGDDHDSVVITIDQQKPPFSQMIPIHDWIIPFQVKFTDEKRKLVEDAVKSWGLSITSDRYPAPSTHSITFTDESNKTRGFVAKVARGHILEKAKGNIADYEYNYCATAGNRKFIMQKYDQCDWTLQRTLDYIGKHIKPDL